MNIHPKSITPAMRVTLFLLVFWVVGLLFAIWLGLGWLFVFEGIRRIIIAVPQIYIPFLRLVVNAERANEEIKLMEKKATRLLYAWRGVVACVWLILTAVVFKFANVRLIDIFR